MIVPIIMINLEINVFLLYTMVPLLVLQHQSRTKIISIQAKMVALVMAYILWNHVHKQKK